MPPAGWKILGQTDAQPVERPEQPYAWYLNGDRFGLVVPLRWPLSHDLEDSLRNLGEQHIMLIWQAFVARASSYPADAPDVVPFPETDEELATYLPMADGSDLPLDYMPWRIHPDRPRSDRPNEWSVLIMWWYREQIDFSKKQMITAFGEALEMMVGLPLERAAPLLHTFLIIEDSGEGDSGSRVTSISTRKKTAAKSGRSRTSSSSNTPTTSNGQISTVESTPLD